MAAPRSSSFLLLSGGARCGSLTRASVISKAQGGKCLKAAEKWNIEFYYFFPPCRKPAGCCIKTSSPSALHETPRKRFLCAALMLGRCSQGRPPRGSSALARSRLSRLWQQQSRSCWWVFVVFQPKPCNNNKRNHKARAPGRGGHPPGCGVMWKDGTRLLISALGSGAGQSFAA